MKEFFVKRKIKKYEQRLSKHDNDPQYFRELAELYLKISQHEPAAKYYQKAIEAYYRDDSQVGEDKEFIIEVCWELLAIEPLSKLACRTLGQEYCGLGEFNEAVQLYKSFADKLIKAARYDEAIVQYSNVLVLVPDNIEIRQEYFSLLWRLRRKEEAVQELRKIAKLAEQAGDIAKALDCYKKSLKIVPSDPELRAELVRVTQVARNTGKPLRLIVNK